MRLEKVIAKVAGMISFQVLGLETANLDSGRLELLQKEFSKLERTRFLD